MKQFYVYMEASEPYFPEHSDNWLCTWIDFPFFLSNLLERDECLNKPVNVKFTVLEMDEGEHEKFVREKDIDLGDL